jgi:hypothetical protein
MDLIGDDEDADSIHKGILTEVDELGVHLGWEKRGQSRNSTNRARRHQISTPLVLLDVVSILNELVIIRDAISDEQNDVPLEKLKEREQLSLMHLLEMTHIAPQVDVYIALKVPKFTSVNDALSELRHEVSAFTDMFGFEPHEVLEMANTLLPDNLVVSKRG